jgi:broad specificity phosphatase PhoE
MLNSRWIYLLRHGDIDSLNRRRFIGQTELPLSSRGREQALWWRDRWASEAFVRVYCSDLERSKRTAELIVGNRLDLMEVRPELREIYLGEWEGLTVDEVNLRYPGEWRRRGTCIDEYRPPGGESFADLSSRVTPLLDEIAAQPARPILMVGHAGVNRVILCHVLGMPLKNLFRLSQDPCCLNIFESKSDELRLRAMNVCPDLP